MSKKFFISNFLACLALIWRYDGLEEDSAPGEVFTTRYGITEMNWREAQRRKVVLRSIDQGTIGDAVSIYQLLFWAPYNFDQIAHGVDLMLFNSLLLTGPGALKRAQAISGVVADGVIGPKTIAALNSKPVLFIPAYADTELAYLKSLSNAQQFIGGWSNRLTFMATEALKMSQGR